MESTAGVHHERHQVVMVAMKGHPGSGKTTLARGVAASLKAPLVDKDDVRDSTHSLFRQYPNLPNHLLNDLSYRVIHRVARTQLQLGLSVVVDSPLSNPLHLARLRHLAAAYGARLLIIHCQPLDEDEWRRRLEQRAASDGDGGDSSHKPATWGDLQKLIEGYGGRADYDVGDVPKLVIDTTAPGVSVEERVSAVLRFIDEHAHHDPRV